MFKKKVLIYLLILQGLILFSCKNTQEKGPIENIDMKGAVDHAKYGTRFDIDPVNSMVNWTGFKPTGSHNGSIMIKKGEVFTDNDGKVMGGLIHLDMKSIECLDIKDVNDKKDLEDHLKSPEFFNVDSFPVVEFFVDSFQIVPEEKTNTVVFGQLTIKGITHSLEIKAHIGMAGDVMMITVPEFKLDRTKWNMTYKSKSTFPNLMDKFINDELSVSMTLLAMRQ